MKFTTQKVSAYALEVDDRFKMGGQMLRILEIGPMIGMIERVHITCFPIKGHERYDRISVMAQPKMKFKIYNQK